MSMLGTIERNCEKRVDDFTIFQTVGHFGRKLCPSAPLLANASDDVSNSGCI